MHVFSTRNTCQTNQYFIDTSIFQINQTTTTVTLEKSHLYQSFKFDSLGRLRILRLHTSPKKKAGPNLEQMSSDPPLLTCCNLWAFSVNKGSELYNSVKKILRDEALAIYTATRPRFRNWEIYFGLRAVNHIHPRVNEENCFLRWEMKWSEPSLGCSRTLWVGPTRPRQPFFPKILQIQITRIGEVP